MLHKTSGVVIKNTKYGESSLISKIYTKDFGLQSYIINGVRKQKPRYSPSLLQPASLLEMVVYNRKNKNLQRVSEIKPAYIYNSLPFHIIKSSIALYILEVFYKSVWEQESHPAVFDYLYKGLKVLDKKESNLANFHLFFLLQLTKLFGFYPNGEYNNETPLFDLKNGSFIKVRPSHKHFLSPQKSKKWSDLLNVSWEDFGQVDINYSYRKELTRSIETYYKLHISSLSTLHTQTVIEAVLQN